MKNYSKLDKFLNEIFGNNNSSHSLSHKNFLEAILKNKKNSYNRILSEQEKNALTPDAFGYLLELAALKSINRYQLEYILLLCINIFQFTSKQLNFEKVEKMVNIIVVESSYNLDPNYLAALLFAEDTVKPKKRMIKN